ncbi:hypothetical protein [Massilia horti]|uniref:Uncharacterized protein n=1 Tax=Massilia horti TaxID=2562153 RepID=A0A4Y9T1C8_9BURK|nr:hypothetical protein [Massilia horti]TFW31308.1 hypothetical protein E4O92_13980 [Massilia horti]
MSITVKNTTAQTGRVTLFGELQDGTFAAKVMAETQVPYGHYWKNEIDKVMVYIEPDEEQLEAILAALNDRRLLFDNLQNYGGATGGTSEIPV